MLSSYLKTSEIRCTLYSPSKKRRVSGVIVARTRERIPEWFKVRIENERTLAYNVSYCKVRTTHFIGDNGLSYGPKVIAPSIYIDSVIPSDAPISRSAVEFFAGCGRLSDAIEAYVPQLKYSTRIDYAKTFPSSVTSMKADIGALSAEKMYKLLLSRYIHLSPTCSTYSQFAQDKHKRNWDSNYLGVTEAAWMANGLLLRLFLALRQRQMHKEPALITIENPDATFHLTPIGLKMQEPIEKGGLGLTLIRFSFCAFGERWRKNSIILTNSPSLIAEFAGNAKLCTSKKGCCFGNGTHTSIGGYKGVSAKVVTPFPISLCKTIALAIGKDLNKESAATYEYWGTSDYTAMPRNDAVEAALKSLFDRTVDVTTYTIGDNNYVAWLTDESTVYQINKQTKVARTIRIANEPYYPRKRGRPPSGKQWDFKVGRYI